MGETQLVPRLPWLLSGLVSSRPAAQGGIRGMIPRKFVCPAPPSTSSTWPPSLGLSVITHSCPPWGEDPLSPADMAPGPELGSLFSISSHGFIRFITVPLAPCLRVPFGSLQSR